MGKYRELRAKQGKGGKWVSGAVYRITVDAFDYRGKRIVVGLEPGDVITFREERSRKTYPLPIKWAYQQAVKQAVDKAKAKKRKPRRRMAKRGLLR